MFRLYSTVFAAALVFGMAAPALAHAFPKTMEPAPNSTADAPPQEVVIDFTEALVPQFSSLEVVNSAGQRVDRHDAHLASNNHEQYIVDLTTLKPGVYKVIWKVTSVDTHKTHGSYDFTVTK